MSVPPPSAAEGPHKGPILTTSPGFAAWLAEARTSLALTTYQAGRLMFLGLRPDGSLRGHERILERCQGLWTDGQSLWASGKSMLWRFENDVPPGVARPQGVDRRFVPREARVTGAIDVHDIAVGQAEGMAGPGPVFVATAFSCLATISARASFRPLWRPRFVSALTPEDRCHLNGLAMDAGRPAFVTALGRSDVADGWRERRADGGVVVDVASGEIVAAGLSMPHSPRIGPDGRLWLLQSGTGEIGVLDPRDGRFEPVAFVPGYARGLAFVCDGRWAVVGLSRPRGNLTFQGLPLEARLPEKGAEPRCGLMAVDVATGHVAQWLRFEHSIVELYDVAALPGVRQAEAIGFRGEDIQRVVTAET